MKTFYRVEHGVDRWCKHFYLGLYESSTSREMFGELHPSPWLDKTLKSFLEEGILDFGSNYIFAFPDLDRLKKWVYKREWLEDLNRLGYVLSVYECDDGYHGDSQSVFNWEKAQLKHRLNLLEV